MAIRPSNPGGSKPQVPNVPNPNPSIPSGPSTPNVPSPSIPVPTPGSPSTPAVDTSAQDAAAQAAREAAAAEAARKAANEAKRRADEQARQREQQDRAREQRAQRNQRPAATTQTQAQTDTTQTQTTPSRQTNVVSEIVQELSRQATPTQTEQTTQQIETAPPVPMTVDGGISQVNPFTGEIVDGQTATAPRSTDLNPPTTQANQQTSVPAPQDLSQTERFSQEQTLDQAVAEVASPPMDRTGVTDNAIVDETEVDRIMREQDYNASRSETDTTASEPVAEVVEETTVEPEVDSTTPPSQPPTPPTNPPVAEAPDPDGPEWKPREERDTSARDEAIDNILSWLKRGNFRTDGMRRVGSSWVLSPEVQAQLDYMMDFFGARPSEEHFLWEAVSQLYALTPDTVDRLFARDNADKQVVFDTVVIDAWKEIERNIMNPQIRQPFAYTQPNMRFAGVYRFPVPILRNELAVFLANGRPNNHLKLTPQELQEFGINEWKQKVLPAMEVKGNDMQKAVIRDMVDAIERNNDTNENYSHRMPDTDFTVDEAYDPLAGWANIFDDVQTLFKVQAMSKETARKYSEEASRIGKKIVVDKDGNITTVRDIVENPASWTLRMMVRAAKATALINPILFGAAVGEHIQGNITNKFAGFMLRGAFGTDPVTNTTREIAQSPEVIDALDDLMRAYSSGNRATIQSYLNGGGTVGAGAMAKTMRELTEGMTSTERAQYYAEYGLNKYAALGHQIASGRVVLQAADAKRFIEALQFAMQRTEGMNITPQTFEAMFKAEPVRFIERMMQEPQGNDALLFAMDNTIAGANIYTEWFQRQMAKSGIGEFAVAAFVTKFMEYGLNLTGKILPLTHTFNYLVTKGVEKYSANKTQVQNLTFGGNDTFSRGLMQNIILDAAWIGTRAGMLLMIYGIMSFLGVEPPDEEEKIGVYGEWKIGGVAIKENWMFRDMLGFITPTAMTLHAAQNGGNPMAIFQDGAQTTLQGLPWLKFSSISESILNFDENLVQAQEETRESWGDEAPSDLEFMEVKAQTWGLTMLANFFEPPLMRLAYQEAGHLSSDDLTSSVTMIYTLNPNDDPNETERTSWANSQFRTVARRYPMIANLLNWADGIGTDKTDGRQQTGYLKEQMPLVELSDPANMYWVNRWNVTDDMSPDEKQAVVNDVISVVGGYDSPAAIAADGIVIPYTARQATYDYCYGTINAIDNQRSIDFATPGLYTQNGKSYDENKLARDQRYADDREKKNFYYAITDRLQDNRIPYSPIKYNQWETDWSARYEWKNSGEPATAMDYLIDRDGVEKIWYASGDHKTSILPFLSVDDRYNTYDAQTPAGWWNEDLSNFDQLQSLYGDKTIQQGMFEGDNVWDLISGSGNAPQGTGENWNPIALTGQRALIPIRPSYDTPTLLDGNRDGAWYGDLGDMGVKSTDSTQIPTNSSYTNYGGRSYSRSGGGGGSGYNPSIYSHPAYSLNADKPASMYAKIPSYTRFDYIRTGFETKGSREAYKRQDI